MNWLMYLTQHKPRSEPTVHQKQRIFLFYMVTSFALQAVINAKNGAVNFLANMVDVMKDPYTLAITAYALSLVGSAKKANALAELRKLATEKGEAKGVYQNGVL